MRAHNLHGWGAYSSEVVIFATSVPDQPAAVTTTRVNSDIEIQWVAPFNNYESIDAYLVAVKSAGGTFEVDTTNCDASTAAILAELRCRVPVSVLTASPFSLAAGATVVAKVQARNARGWGALSAENTAGAIIITVPSQMAAPVRDSTATSTVQIKVTWLALATPQDGNSAILSYNLEWDAGSSGATWTEVVGESTDYLLTHFTVSSGLLPGQSYQFRVRARNSLGWGEYSSAATVKAATRPDQMAGLTTELDAATGGVKVTLVAPSDNSETISAYKVEFAHGASWSEASTACDGSSATVLSNMYCIVPMSTLRAAPFSLVFDDAIQVRAQAYNAYGWGDVSDPVGTLSVKTEPTKMAAPVRGSGTTTSLLQLTWVALSTSADTGGATVTSYNVQWDAGTGGVSPTWTHL